MAAGDLAATVAGFVSALSSDDLRLGYGKIDEAADLGIKYGQLRFTNATTLLAFTQAQQGQRAVDLATGDEYRWNGTAWQLWTVVGVKNYSPTYTGLALGNGTATHYYRMVDGLLLVYGSVAFGSTTAISGLVDIALPITAPSTGLIVSQVNISGVTTVDGLCTFGSSAANLRMKYRAVSGSNVVRADFSASAPFTWATGHSFTFMALVRAY